MSNADKVLLTDVDVRQHDDLSTQDSILALSCFHCQGRLRSYK